MLFFRLLLLTVITINTLSAQIQPKFGLRAGANFSGIAGPSEIGDSSQNLEQYKITPKIAVAAFVRVPFSKRFGFSAELAFTQRGAAYRYTSYSSYLKVPSSNLLFEGHQRKVTLNLINGYIEVPALFLAEPIDDRLLLEFGPSISFLISSRALGTLKYIDPDHSSQIMEYNLDYKYLRDDAGEYTENIDPVSGKVDGTTIPHPHTIGGYYFLDEKDKNPYYNIIDVGLNFGVSYYFTQGLRLGVRGYYGLLDISNNKMDVDQQRLNTDKSLILRPDRDVNYSFQVFVGLQF